MSGAEQENPSLELETEVKNKARISCRLGLVTHPFIPEFPNNSARPVMCGAIPCALLCTESLGSTYLSGSYYSLTLLLLPHTSFSLILTACSPTSIDLAVCIVVSMPNPLLSSWPPGRPCSQTSDLFLSLCLSGATAALGSPCPEVWSPGRWEGKERKGVSFLFLP